MKYWNELTLTRPGNQARQYKMMTNKFVSLKFVLLKLKIFLVANEIKETGLMNCIQIVDMTFYIHTFCIELFVHLD